MADNWTMAQLLQAPTEGYEDAIVIPEINANFELKHVNPSSAEFTKQAGLAKVSSNSSTLRISPDVAALTTEVSELKNLMKTMLIDKKKAQAPASVKSVEQSCVTCGDEPFSGSSTIHSDALPPSSSPVKTSDNLEKFADELTLLDSFPPDNDDSVLKNDVHEENFHVYSNPLFEFDDNFNSSNKSDIDEIDAFLSMEVSTNVEEGYYDSEGDVIFLESLLSDDTTHNLSPEVIFDHELKQNESDHNTSISFSPRSDPLHHELAGEIITLHSRIAREHENILVYDIAFVRFLTSR
ncbi:hypothetical protein Tco_0031056 [Tanacetum coccineum]